MTSQEIKDVLRRASYKILLGSNWMRSESVQTNLYQLGLIQNMASGDYSLVFGMNRNSRYAAVAIYRWDRREIDFYTVPPLQIEGEIRFIRTVKEI